MSDTEQKIKEKAMCMAMDTAANSTHYQRASSDLRREMIKDYARIYYTILKAEIKEEELEQGILEQE